MLNNEFRLIGTIVSDYEKVGSDKFPKYEVKIEVERKTKGKANTYTLVVYEKNFSVDVNNPLTGKKVIASGYLDSYKDYLSLVVQDIIVIGGEADEIKLTENVFAGVETNADLPVHAAPVVSPDTIDLPDDDLPF